MLNQDDQKVQLMPRIGTSSESTSCKYDDPAEFGSWIINLCFDVRSTLIISLLILHSACLPIDQPQPDCFPEEGCERGLICQAGRCLPPSPSKVKVKIGCLNGPSCQESLEDKQANYLCLIVEQPGQLLGRLLQPEQVRSPDGEELTLPLMTGPLRASVIFVQSSSTSPTCDADEAIIERLNWHRSCEDQSGCVLRLRRPMSNFSEGTPSIDLEFSDEQGRCYESIWGGEAPFEQCGGGDADCDGFSDEGIACEPSSFVNDDGNE